MNEVPSSELDLRLQKQVALAKNALTPEGTDYVIQVCGELLKKNPAAYEVRAVLWEALLPLLGESGTATQWLANKSAALQFQLAARKLLKKDPLDCVRLCDEALTKKQFFREVFVSLQKAASSLQWIETRLLALQAIIALQVDKPKPRIELAEALLEAKRPKQAIEQLEYILSLEPTHAEAQTLLKNASVAETLQRGNWEDQGSSFRTKINDD